jgi:hypothetical protein
MIARVRKAVNACAPYRGAVARLTPRQRAASALESLLPHAIARRLALLSCAH